MENEQGFSIGLKKLARWAGYLLLVLIFLAWVVLWARRSANLPGVIQVRKFYNERVLEEKYLPDALPYVIQVRESSEEGYVYELWGRIKTLDYVNYIMTLEDKRGQEWKVQMIHPPYHNANKIGIEMHEFEVERDSGKVVGRAVPLTIDRRDPDKTQPYLAVGDMMSVVWKEQMTLAQIYERNRNNDYLVVVPSDTIRPIRKVVGK